MRDSGGSGGGKAGDPAGQPGGADSNWMVGADGVVPAPRRSGSGVIPVGRLHAVDGDALLHGRAVCLAPVVPLDPAGWRWTGDDAAGAVCWICLALTHRLSATGPARPGRARKPRWRF